MTQNEIIIMNFEEIRRRSIKLWLAITPDIYFWRPDSKAISCLEMVRHVLEGEHIYHLIVKKGGDLGDFISPWKDRQYTDLQAEFAFAEPFRRKFIAAIEQFNPEDFSAVEIVRPEKNQRRRLGDYLQRIGYHEAVHAGQMLSYLRTLRVERPQIWD